MAWYDPLLGGILLGLGAAAPIGPVNVEIARRTLRGGFRRGFALGCGAVTVDVFYAVVTGLSLQRLIDRPFIIVPLAAAGIALLFYLSFQCLRGAVRDLRTDRLADHVDPGPAAKTTARGAYLTGVLMTLFNPMTLAFWFTVVPGMAAAGPAVDQGLTAANTEGRRFDLPMICGGVFIGTVSWVVFFAGVLSLAGTGGRGSGRRRWLAAAADLAGGVTLLAFACLALWRLWRLWRSGDSFL